MLVCFPSQLQTHLIRKEKLMWWRVMGAGEVLPKWKRAEKSLGFFLTYAFSSQHFVYLSWPPEFPEPFRVVPTNGKEKVGSVLAFLRLQSKAVEQELLQSVTRDERPCWALPAHPQLEQQKHSKSGISSLGAGCAAAVLSLQWEGQGQWLNSPQVIRLFYLEKKIYL